MPRNRQICFKSVEEAVLLPLINGHTHPNLKSHKTSCQHPSTFSLVHKLALHCN